MADQSTPLHSSDLISEGYDTNEYDKRDGNGPFRNESGCPVEDFHPAWCHRKGDLAALGPDGLLYPPNAFGPNGAHPIADFKLCGVFNDNYTGGVFNGNEYGTCNQLPSCAPCTTYYTCAGITAKLLEPAALGSKTLLKIAVDPALVGTSLEGSLGMCFEPSTNSDDPLNVGVVEVSTMKNVLQDDGTYAPDGSKSALVCAFVGVGLKENGKPYGAAAEEKQKEEERQTAIA